MNYKKFLSISLLCISLSTFCMEQQVDKFEKVESLEGLSKSGAVALLKAKWERACDAYLYKEDPRSPIYYAYIADSGQITYCMNADYSKQNEPLDCCCNPQGASFHLRSLTNREKRNLAEMQAAGKIIFNVPADALQVAE